MESAKKKKTNWSPFAEEMLLEIWEANIVDLRGARKNGHIFKQMAESLKNAGVCVSSEEVRSKINNLTGKYRKEKGNIGVSGGSPSDWPHYQRVHAIIGGFKCNNIEELVEESVSIEYLFNTPSSEVLDISGASCSDSLAPVEVECAGCSKSKKQKLNASLITEIQETKELIKTMHQEENVIDSKLVNIEERRNVLLEEFL
ncbi:myb/SANT-like DNA-binding domain-containing protein 1 [Rhagoletis pomonella]|uniref:myb/SANT-like DNA-binding domain-containing protein 1 n=1 Tax=Rhagoletis pomonella TaxID=28610 RepID=UPI001785D286|nr:myb/SANT-like DNA-binding domain-containing protein 1 [Rhagoletis pomonella]